MKGLSIVVKKIFELSFNLCQNVHMDLLKTQETIRSKLLARKGDWDAIAAEAGVSTRWIRYFTSGELDSPRVKTLADLQKALGMK